MGQVKSESDRKCTKRHAVGFGQKTTILAVVVLLAGLLMGGCSAAPQTTQINSAMAEYDSIEAVDSYYRHNSTYINELTEAWKKKDKDAFEQTKTDLVKLCEDFIAVTDVPAEVKDMHDHMVNIANLEEDYARSLDIDDYESAEKALDKIDQEVEKARESLANK